MNDRFPVGARVCIRVCYPVWADSRHMHKLATVTGAGEGFVRIRIDGMKVQRTLRAYEADYCLEIVSTGPAA